MGSVQPTKTTGRIGRMHGEIPAIIPATNPMANRPITTAPSFASRTTLRFAVTAVDAWMSGWRKIYE